MPPTPTPAPGAVTLDKARKRSAVGGVPSPCVGVCRMVTATALCEGCWRSLDEITTWSRASDDQRLAIWARIEARQVGAGGGAGSAA